MHKLRERKGYIAITSVTIISIILMALVFTVSYTGYLNRFNILDTTSKKISRAAAEACVAEARLKMAQNILYTGNETIVIGQNQCDILLIENNIPGVQKTIKTKASVRMAVTNLKVVVATPGLAVISWEELANF